MVGLGVNTIAISMQLRSKVGLEAQKLKCNCVLGYQQYFDVEGDSGIVGRAVGTACMYV